MTVTTGFSFVAGEAIDLGPLTGVAITSVSTVGFPDGSFAIAVTRDGSPDHVEVLRFDAAGSPLGPTVTLDGVNPTLTRLASGDLAVATENGAGDVLLSVLTVDDSVVTNLAIGEDFTTAPDVAGLSNGGFVVVTQDNFTATDNDIEVFIRNANGSDLTSFAIDDSLDDDRNPSVAALTGPGGGFAVAWERHVGGETEIWYAVYDNNGGEVKAAALLDTTGTINRNVSVTALSNGGFAMAYEDNAGATLDIRLTTFASNGTVVNSIVIGGGAAEVGADVVEIAPNIIAVSQEGDFFGPTNTNPLLVVIDLNTSSIIAQLGVNVTPTNDFNTVIATTAPGVLVAFTQHTDGTISGEAGAYTRTQTSDGDGDSINGTEIRDILNGNGGNDTLVGAAGRDQHFGGSGDDDLQTGDDQVVAGEVYDGGDDFDYLTVFGSNIASIDFRTSTVTAIEQLYLANANGGGQTVRFNADQFAFQSVFFETQGVLGARTVSIDMEDLTTLDLSGLDIQGTVGAGDHFAINGDGDAETITGTSIDDIIDGGAGADTLRGGAGNDTYTIDDAGDVVDESVPGSNGVDTVQSSIGVDLNGDTTGFLGDIENVTLTGSAFFAVGNGLANTITGNGDGNILEGRGGADIIHGGAGNDTINVFFIDDISGETYDGGDDFDTLELGSSFSNTNYDIDLRDDTLKSIEKLLFRAPASPSSGGQGIVRMNASQFGGTGVALNATLDVQSTNRIYTLDVTMDVDTLDLSGLDVTGFAAANSSVVITGNANVNTITGTAGRDLLDGVAGADTMRGLAGGDVYFIDNAGDVADESVAGSDGFDTVQSSISFSLSDTVHAKGAIENVILLGNSINLNALGNSLNNILIGTNNANSLNGLLGADTMQGGGGNDTYTVDNAGDIVNEADSGSGIDTVRSTISFSLVASATVQGDVENVTLLGAADLNALGNGLANLLIGNTGANSLNGGLGADTMRGGAGNDTYTVDNAGDIADESVAGSGGVDTVRSTISFSLADGVHALGSIENLTLLGSGNLNGLGNDLNNTLIGNTGANTLNGGLGADTMQGGAGNDNYTVENAGDIVDESVAGSAGLDLIRSTISFSLADAVHAKGDIENLTLLGTANLNALGNALNNVLVGNAGANTLNGGLGADTMQGGIGNDLYTVDNAGDIVDESVGGSNGIDLIRSTVSLSLVASATVKGAIENLTLLGTANLNGLGNDLNNTLTGNGGANTLNGGLGADIMRGGAGNDSYAVDSLTDLVDESVAGSAGVDLVRSTVSFNLTSATQALGTIENVTLLGATNINVTGNSVANVLIGNTGANLIVGGLGNDTITTGAGNDVILFNAALGAANVDTITDMNEIGNDTIRLENAVFTALTTTGLLAASAFRIGAAALDADDHIIYNNANGQLIYDINGSGAGGAVVFAILDAGLALTAADFVVV